MQRIACILAIMGLSLQTVGAQDSFQKDLFQQPSGRQSFQFHSQANGTPATAQPQRFTRDGVATTKTATVPAVPSTTGTATPRMPNAKPGDALKNYHQELFGSATPSATATNPNSPAAATNAAPSGLISESAGVTTLLPATTPETQPADPIASPASASPAASPFAATTAPKPTDSQPKVDQSAATAAFGPMPAAVEIQSVPTSQPTNGTVTQAAFSAETDAPSGIQQVAGDVIARPFPSQNSATSATPAQQTFARPTTAPATNNRFTFNPPPQQQPTTTTQGTPTVRKNQLTKPIAITAPGEAAPKTTRGTLTIQRPLPNQRAPRNPLPTTNPALQANPAPQIPAVPPSPSAFQRAKPNTPSAPRPRAMATPQRRTVTEEETGPQTPSVTIQWVKKSSVNVGQECRCDLVVKNDGEATAHEVEVEAFFPKNVRLVNSEPRPSESASYLGWEFDELEPGEEKVIHITMIPLERGNIATHADVRFSGTAHGAFTVAEPLLELKMTGPQEIFVGDPASHTVTVTNPGTGVATNVKIEALIPKGLEHARGERLLMELGSLNPGESRSVRLAMAAVQGGRHIVQVQARADADLVRTAAAELMVIAPSLTAKVTGPKLRYLGREGTFILAVTNDGVAATDNVRVMHKIPEGFEFITSDRGAQYDAGTRILTWFVGRLESGQHVETKVTLNAKSRGEFKHLVRATSEHGTFSDAELRTVIEGSSALAVEIVDLDDPVEVGTEAIYEVRVKNEGSASARNIGLTCELAPGMNYLSANGPADHIAEKQLIVFRTIGELGAGKTATFRVHVSSVATGNALFRARVLSESVAEPLTTEELTKFYGE